jgi:hypothetical protein
MGKIEIIPPPDRLEYMLCIWADYVKSGGKFERGYSHKACGFVGAGNTSVDDMQDANDLYIAQAVDTIVNQDLPDEECSAIHHQYLDARYRGLIVFYPATLRRAKDMIKGGLVKKGIW